MQLENGDGTKTSSDHETAELLCKSFEEFFTTEAEFNPSTSGDPASSKFSESLFGCDLFNETEVLNK